MSALATARKHFADASCVKALQSSPGASLLSLGVSGVIELAAVIRDQHVELEKAVAASDGAVLRFELWPVEVEVLVAAERSASARAAVKFWEVQARAGGKLGTSDNQWIKLSPIPKLLLPDGASPYVSRQAVSA